MLQKISQKKKKRQLLPVICHCVFPSDRLPGGGVILFVLLMHLFITDNCNNSQRWERERQRERGRESYDLAAHSRDSDGQSAHSVLPPIITPECAEDVSQHHQRTLNRSLGYFLESLSPKDRTILHVWGII